MTNLEKLIDTLRDIPRTHFVTFLMIQNNCSCEICIFDGKCNKDGVLDCRKGVYEFVKEALLESEVEA